ncbi:hypothetical protein [Vibrio lentus]|uniref:hypothetical protein n=1 Tax=Vibrio lentus TaxID=136468 RepID=UPI003D13645C
MAKTTESTLFVIEVAWLSHRGVRYERRGSRDKAGCQLLVALFEKDQGTESSSI